MKQINNKPWILAALAFVAIGILLRLYRITANEFIFYDEGMYLGYNRKLLMLIAQQPPESLAGWMKVWEILLKMSLSTAKALWFLISNIRIFWGGVDAWYFPRVVSAIAGIGTIGLTYLFAKRYFNSVAVGLLAAVLLALMPGHVFYSRLAMQESFSTLCVLGGLYLYFFPHKFGIRTFLSALLLTCAFFSNYRLIILPVHLVVVEVCLLLAGQRIDWRHGIWSLLTFCGVIFGIGALEGGSNTFATFGWMFHQANQAKQAFDLINFLSFPYYLFVLESVFLAALFFANVWFVWRREWNKLLPFALVLVQMMIFSFAAEKGARYLCVMLPFVAMASAAMFIELSRQWTRRVGRIALGVVLFSMIGAMLWFDVAVTGIRSGSQSDYELPVRMVKSVDPQAHFLSTQPLVHQLYVSNPSHVAPAPDNLGSLLKQFVQGYRYLIVDPQAYISWTESGKRFDPPLGDYLGFVESQCTPIRTFDHFNPYLMNRFVYDHNENLKTTVKFLNSERHAHQIRLYALAPCLAVMKQRMGL